MFSENLSALRKLRGLSQEDVAELAGVSRQAVAKWESGESLPDIEKCRKLAEAFEVTLDDLVCFEAGPAQGDLMPPPKGKHLFGVVTVGEKGQIVIPSKARRIFSIQPGDQLVVLGDENTGLALMRAESFLSMADEIRRAGGGKP